MYRKLGGLWYYFTRTFFGPRGYLSFNEFKAKFPNVKTDFLLYEGILTAIKRYKRRLGLDV